MPSVDRAQVPIEPRLRPTDRVGGVRPLHRDVALPRIHGDLGLGTVAAIAVLSSHPWPSGVVLRLSPFVGGRKAMSGRAALGAFR